MAQNEIAENRAVKAIRGGSLDEAIKTLMNAYGNDIYRYCLSMLSSPADAQDTLQTVFLQAYQGLTRFAGKSSFRTWLYAIARHRCLDRLKIDRRHQARVEYTDQPPEMSSPAHFTDNRVNQILQRCLSRLTKRVRQAVLLRFQADLSYSEIADQAKEKAGTLQARVARAMPALRQCVEEHGLSL